MHGLHRRPKVGVIWVHELSRPFWFPLSPRFGNNQNTSRPQLRHTLPESRSLLSADPGQRHTSSCPQERPHVTHQELAVQPPGAGLLEHPILGLLARTLNNSPVLHRLSTAAWVVRIQATRLRCTPKMTSSCCADKELWGVPARTSSDIRHLSRVVARLTSWRRWCDG